MQMLEKTDSSLVQPMSEAIYNQDCEALARLLKEHPQLAFQRAGADANWLKAAAHDGSIPIIALLLDAGSDIEGCCEISADKCAGPPLATLIARGHLEAAKYILSRGASPYHARLLIAATNAEQNSLELVKLLVEHGADINREYTWGGDDGPLISAVTWAQMMGRQDIVDYLLSKGGKLQEVKPRAPTTRDEEVIDYFSKHFGPVHPLALRDIVPTAPGIAIHRIPASVERPYLTLFTTGMSSRAMIAPVDNEETAKFRYAELFIQLPADWPLDLDSLADPDRGWPIRWLRFIGTYPHQSGEWLGGPIAIVANGELPKPFAPKTPFTSMLLVAERSLVSREGLTIQLYRLTPIFTEERDLEKREGMEALFKAFTKRNVPMVVDVNRTSAV